MHKVYELVFRNTHYQQEPMMIMKSDNVICLSFEN